MRIVVLSSSSAGNSTYIELGSTKFLIDAGLGFNDMKNKLFEINVNPEDLDFIIVTHAHSDHIKSIHSFNRVFNTKIYISRDTYNEYTKNSCLTNFEFIDSISQINDIGIIKVPISHDKKGYGYIFSYNNISIAYMADTGMIHKKYHDLFMNKTYYLFESNHDVEMEMNGTKDEYTKIRNIGDMGHLSNEDCARLLNIFVGNNTKGIILIHISDKDNTHELAYSVSRSIIDSRIPIYLSYKDKISETINI